MDPWKNKNKTAVRTRFTSHLTVHTYIVLGFHHITWPINYSGSNNQKFHAIVDWLFLSYIHILPRQDHTTWIQPHTLLCQSDSMMNWTVVLHLVNSKKTEKLQKRKRCNRCHLSLWQTVRRLNPLLYNVSNTSTFNMNSYNSFNVNCLSTKY